MVIKPWFWTARDTVVAVAKGGNLFALAGQAHSVKPDHDHDAEDDGEGDDEGDEDDKISFNRPFPVGFLITAPNSCFYYA